MKLLRSPVSLFVLFGATVFFFLLYKLLASRSFKIRYSVLRVIGYIVYKVWAKGRKRLYRNLSLIRPDLNQEQLNIYARKLISTIARDWAIILGAENDSFASTLEIIEIDGVDKIMSYIEIKETGEGKQVIADKVVVAPIHMGSFSGVLSLLNLFQIPIYAPAERIQPKYLLDLMIRLRERNGFLKLEPIERGKTFDKMVQRMRCGWAVGLMVDILAKKPNKGVICRIGNGQGEFETGAVKLALAENAVIFPAFVVWTGDKYQVVVEDPFVVINTGDFEKDIQLNTQRLVEERIAPWIQKYPDQWMQAPWADLKPSLSLN